MYADINNDNIKEYVERIYDGNKIAAGRGWWVYGDYDLSSSDFIPL